MIYYQVQMLTGQVIYDHSNTYSQAVNLSTRPEGPASVSNFPSN
jgi:hypothetical protein